MDDHEFLADLLRAASKVLAQEAVNLRYRELGNRSISNDCLGMLNSVARCQILAEKYKAMQS